MWPTIKGYSNAVVLLFALIISGCTSNYKNISGLALQDALVATLPNPKTSEQRILKDWNSEILAANNNWSLRIRWKDDELLREVLWKEGQDEIRFVVALKNRNAPFCLDTIGAKTTRYGPYQPAYYTTTPNGRLYVTMSHEKVNFATVSGLKSYLNWAVSGGYSALCSDCNLLVQVYRSCDNGNSISVRISYIILRGSPVAPDLIDSFDRGNIEIKKP